MKPRAAPALRFGTSGWRGLLAEEFTFDRVRAAVHAVGSWLAGTRPGARVVVAHDRRLLGEPLVALAARVLRATGARPLLAVGPVATPVAVHGLHHARAAAALVFTASHNPPEYHGLKVIGPEGGALDEAETRRIEALAARALARGPVPEAAGRTPSVELVTPYLEELAAELDGAALRRARLEVTFDALHGCGAGVLDTALRRLGARVTTLRGERDPFFGGEAPDPEPARLGALARRVARGRGARLGVATDGDADRFAVVDADGRILSETHALALLVDHLARSGRLRRGVAISVATGSLVARIAEHHGLAVSRHRIGFKHLSRALASGAADAAGEESGGFALGRFGRDKDGILAASLLAELVAVTRAPLRARLAELERRFGPCACGRTAWPAGPAAREALARLEAAPPSRLGGAPVRAVERVDGLRLAFDDGFLMLRSSGTEPVLRVYAEAHTASALARRLRTGARWLGVSRARVESAAPRARGRLRPTRLLSP